MEFPDEEIEYVCFMELPPDLDSITSMLRDACVCQAGYEPLEDDIYAPEDFLEAREIHGVRTVLLPDRNVVSRLAQLARGKAVSTDNQLRLAAALIAFAQFNEIDIEPAISYHELAYKQGKDAALEELGWFKAADNGNAQEFIDVALSRCDALTSQYQPRKVPDHDLTKFVSVWKRNYVCALKMAEIEGTMTTPLDRITTFLNWMRDDFRYGGSAAIFAAIYWGPNSSPKKSVFKDKNSTDRERAIEGIKNTAWDLAHLADFVRRVDAESDEPPSRFLFATFDQYLQFLAGIMLAHSQHASSQQWLTKTFSRWWEQSDAEKIVAIIMEHGARIEATATQPKERRATPERLEQLIAAGEAIVRAYQPQSL
jgi:hypothetical protein